MVFFGVECAFGKASRVQIRFFNIKLLMIGCLKADVIFKSKQKHN